MVVDRLIEEYLDAVEAAQGPEVRARTEVRWTGGTRVVIRNTKTGKSRLVDVGTLRSMIEALRRNGAELRKAA